MLLDDTSSSDDLDLILLELMVKPKQLLGPRLHLEDLSDLECERLFRWAILACKERQMHAAKLCCSILNCHRFSKDDLPRLAAALSLPEQYTCEQGTSATGMEALLVLLRRLAYPNRLCDLVPLFGRSEFEISLIFNKVSHLCVLYSVQSFIFHCTLYSTGNRWHLCSLWPPIERLSFGVDGSTDFCLCHTG